MADRLFTIPWQVTGDPREAHLVAQLFRGRFTLRMVHLHNPDGCNDEQLTIRQLARREVGQRGDAAGFERLLFREVLDLVRDLADAEAYMVRHNGQAPERLVVLTQLRGWSPAAVQQALEQQATLTPEAPAATMGED
jgi:hypothetical protein